MDLSIKEKILIGSIGAIVVLVVGGSIWSLVSGRGLESSTENHKVSSHKELTDSSVERKDDVKDSESKTADDEDLSRDESNKSDEHSSVSSYSSDSSTKASNNKSQNNTQKSETSSSTSDSNSYSSYTQPVAKCNEDMKENYKKYRDSQVAVENARWANQLDRFHSEASGNGMSFSGAAQDMINKARPAHEANLSNIEAQYQDNLWSANCV